MTQVGLRCPWQCRAARQTPGATFPQPSRPCASSGCRYASSAASRPPPSAVPFSYRLQLIDRVRPRLGAVVEPDLHERRPFDGSEPRLAPPHIEQSPADPVAPRHLGNVHFRIGALGQDPRLLRIAPIAPTPQPRYHLDALIRVGIMPGLMHGMSAPRMSKSKCESRSAERHKRGGAAVPVTVNPGA